MKKITFLLLLLVGLCINSQAQTLSVRTSLSRGVSSGDVVNYAGAHHALEGSEVTYSVSLSTTDSIGSVTKFDYIFNGSTKNINHRISDGRITIDPVVMSNLSPTSSDVVFECSMTYTTKKNGKDTTIVVNAVNGDPIHIYANPKYSISEPKNYVYYQRVTGCYWQILADGGGEWKCKWNSSDEGTTETKYYSYSGSNNGNSKKTVNISLSMVNYAPDGTTVWGYGESKTYTIDIYPKADVSVTPATNHTYNPEELFQDQVWDLSVSESGGYPDGWLYEWKDEKGNIVGTGKSYQLSSERSKNNISKHVSLTVYNKGKLTDGSVETWYSSTVYNWYAAFLPCPVVEFDKNYPSDMIYGDNVELGFVITDDDGNSLLDNSKYNWNYTWTYNNWDYNSRNITITANNDYNNDGDVRTVTLNVTGKLDNGKNYSTKRTHTISMWPTPNIGRPYDSPLEQDACGGQTKQLSVTPFGGVKSGWKYTWYKNDGQVSSGDSNTYDAFMEYDAEDFSTSRDTYYVIAENYCEGVCRFTDKLQYSVTKYPRPIVSESLELYDENRAKSVETGIREGNTILASISNCYGGYWDDFSDHWSYQWFRDDRLFTDERQFSTQASTNFFVDKMAKLSQSYMLNVYNSYYDGTRWEDKTITKDITVYHRPATPMGLVRKGNGTSCTFIAQSSLTDYKLNDCDYYLVFGYTDVNGVDHPQREIKQETGTTRFSSFDYAVFNNSSNTFWVYSLWKYADGPYITSGKRYVNRVDEHWDGSVYSDAEISSRGFEDYADGIIDVVNDNVSDPEFLYTLSGKMVPRSQTKGGVYIVNGKKVLVK